MSGSSTGAALPLAAQAVPKPLRLDDYLPYRLSVAANAVSQLVARAYVERFGLTVPQWRLMAVLGEDTSLTQQALCRRTLMDKVTVTRATRALERRRLIRRQPNAEDGRSHRLSLTAAGERMYAQVVPLALQYEAVLLRGLAPGQVRLLEQWLRQLQLTAAALTGDGAVPGALR
jgi:DNA-binding MarR family transcriptional regulator